ncbi:hypothetical protein C8J57DRAFT_990139, partial [Mycena rebaudengoi]
VQKSLESPVKENPVGVFAATFHYEWEQLARQAAKQCLRLPIHSLYINALKLISAPLYHSRLLYHDRCGLAASSAGAMLPRLKATWSWITCKKCTPCPVTGGVLGQHVPQAWIFDYADRAHEALKKTPRASPLDHSFLTPTLLKAAACGSCGMTALADLVNF